MSLARTLVLGLIAGSTIVLGLPLARLRRPAAGARVVLNAVAVGILLFLFWDILSAAWAPIDTALSGEGGPALSRAAGHGALTAAGLSIGLIGLVAFERWISASSRSTPSAPAGPGAMRVDELRGPWEPLPASRWTPGRRLALVIAVGIGLHNLAEGLAIGQSARSGQIALATTLVVGFGLHNATEGFGIAAPLAADVPTAGSARRPSWALLLMLGLIGGGPTFLGTWFGYSVTGDAVRSAILGLAGGSILFVVIQLIQIAGKARRSDLVAYGVLVGLIAGFVTDAVVTAGGA